MKEQKNMENRTPCYPQKLIRVKEQKEKEGKTITKKVQPVRVKGRVTKVIKQVKDTSELIQGVKLKDQPEFEGNASIKGSNGSYRKFGPYEGMELLVKATLYDVPIFEYEGKKYVVNERVEIDCYEELRKLVGEKVWNNIGIKETTMGRIQSTLQGEKCEIALLPIYVEDGIMYVWLQIMDKYYTEGDLLAFPFGGFIMALESE